MDSAFLAISSSLPVVTRGDDHTVDGRRLHVFLENKDQFSHWMQDRIEQYDFLANKDFWTFRGNSLKGRPSLEYALTIGMAKELCMVEGNDQGKKARLHFIACEEQLKVQPRLPQTPQEMLEWATGQLAIYAAKNLELTPKAAYADHLANTEGLFGIRQTTTAIGSALGLKVTVVEDMLVKKGFFHRQGGRLMPTYRYRNPVSDCCRVLESEGKDGKLYPQTFLTSLGRQTVFGLLGYAQTMLPGIA